MAMTRIKDGNGVVHFRNPGNREMTLCGQTAVSNGEVGLFGDNAEAKPFNESKDIVICLLCAKVYCAVKNEPWNSVEDTAMDFGMYEAVKDDSVPMHETDRCPGHSDTENDECVGHSCKYWGMCGYSKEIIKDRDWEY